MVNRLLRLAPWFVCLLLAGCAQLPGNSGWNQFHGGALNRGYQHVRSPFATTPRWSLPIDEPGFGSPVIGANGVVYLATLDNLMAVNSSGSVLWQASVGDEKFLSSAAVGRSGRVYVVSTREDDTRLFGVASTLHAYNAFGARIWSFTLPDEGFSLSSPKTWTGRSAEYVFLYGAVNRPAGALRGQGALYILDQNGNLVQSEIGTCNFELVGEGPGFGEFFEELWDDFLDLIDGIEFDTSGQGISEWFQRLGWAHPTVAIQTGAPADAETPIVVVVDRYCTIRGYRWDAPDLTLLWEQKHTLRDHSSPSVSGGLVVVGGKDGKVRAYDVQNGTPIWEYTDARKDERYSFLATPSHFIAPIYVVDIKGNIHALGLNGQIWRKQAGSGYSTASPAQTIDKLYTIDSAGFHTYSSDLVQHFEDAGLRSGTTSPAVGPDGTVYVAGWTSSGAVLRAYPGSTQP